MAVVWTIFLLLAIYASAEAHFNSRKPNIIFMVSDDTGHNDVPWNNPNIIAPYMDFLARTGVILDQSYVQSICSPSRSAFMTGYYPFRNGLNRFVIPWFAKYGLPTQFKLLPEYMKDLGYETNMLGKWHLGSCHPDYLPQNRGFDHFVGFHSAATYYYNHTYPLTNDFKMRAEVGTQDVYDLFEKSNPLPNYNGTHTMEVLIEKLKENLNNRDKSKPQFYYVAWPAMHSPIEYPKEYEKYYADIQNPYRKGFCSFVTYMDSCIGRMMAEFVKAGIYQNSVLLFTTDNGGETKSGGNNYPLRGAKITLYEGGTRGVAFVHSPLLKKRGYRHKGLIQAVDYPYTIIKLANGTIDPDMDGVSFWDSVSEDKPSLRADFPYDINVNIYNTSKYDGAYRNGPWKLIVGDARLPKTQIEPENVTGQLYDNCGGYLTVDPNYPEFQLFNIDDDPTESTDLAASMPEKVQELYAIFKEKYIKRMVVSIYSPQDIESYKNATPDLTYLNTNWCKPITTVTPMFP